MPFEGGGGGLQINPDFFFPHKSLFCTEKQRHSHLYSLSFFPLQQTSDSPCTLHPWLPQEVWGQQSAAYSWTQWTNPSGATVWQTFWPKSQIQKWWVMFTKHILVPFCHCPCLPAVRKRCRDLTNECYSIRARLRTTVWYQYVYSCSLRWCTTALHHIWRFYYFGLDVAS